MRPPEIVVDGLGLAAIGRDAQHRSFDHRSEGLISIGANGGECVNDVRVRPSGHGRFVVGSSPVDDDRRGRSPANSAENVDDFPVADVLSARIRLRAKHLFQECVGGRIVEAPKRLDGFFLGGGAQGRASHFKQPGDVALFFQFGHR